MVKVASVPVVEIREAANAGGDEGFIIGTPQAAIAVYCLVHIAGRGLSSSMSSVSRGRLRGRG